MNADEIAVVVRNAIAQEFAALKEAKALAESAAAILDGCADTLELAEKPEVTQEHIRLHKIRLRRKAALIRASIKQASSVVPEPVAEARVG